MAHLVARQTVEFTARDRRHAEALSARTSAAGPAMAAAIARVLDALDRPHHRIRLDTVAIDLGPCDPAQWEAALVAGIERELGARLRAALDAPDVAAAAAPPPALELLTVFARTGRLPWWAGAADLPGAAIMQLAATGAPPQQVRRLLGLPGAVERFVHQLDDAALAALVMLALLPGGAPVAFEAGHLLQDAAPRLDRASTTERRHYWAAVLRKAAQGLRDGVPADPLPGPEPSRPAAVPDRTGQVASRGGSGETLPAAALAARLEAFRVEALLHRRPHVAEPVQRLAALVHRLDAGAAQAALQALAADSEPEAAALDALVATLRAAGALQGGEALALQQALATVQPPADAHDAIAIDCAGLPLLAPFLPGFFAGMELLVERDFRDEAARHRAIGLMHFLASGEPEAPEPRLPLAKLLAGLPLDAVHQPTVPPGADDLAACDALLAAVIGHAPMLGRISIEGLRASFLMRPGTLATRDGHWLLRVERRSFDLLLDRLPWSINWVRLPWMAAPLQIEW